jgi:hypothetical protein
MYVSVSTSVAVSKPFAGRADAQIAQLTETSTASRMGNNTPGVLYRSGSEGPIRRKKRKEIAMQIKVQPIDPIDK